MALNSLGLGFTFTARDLASGQIRRLSGSFNRMQGTATRGTGAMAGGFVALGTGAAIMGAGLGTLAVGFRSAQAASALSQQLAFLGEITGRSGAALDELRQSAVDAALATKFSPDQAIRGLRELVTAGLNATAAMAALTPSLQLATIGQIEVADASRAIVGSLNSFVGQGLTATGIADRLATTMARTNFQAADFAIGLSSVAGVAGLFNQTLDDTLVGMGLLRNRNISASRSATALRESIRRLATDAGTMERVQKLGIETFDESTGTMRSVIDIMFEVKQATDSMTAAERSRTIGQTFGARGVQAFGAITQANIEVMRNGRLETLQGVEAVHELRRALAEAAGAAERQQEAMLDTFAGQLQLLEGVTQGFQVSFGRIFELAFKPIVLLIKEGLEALTRFIGGIPDPIKKAIGGIIIVLSVLATGFGGMVVAAGIFALLLPFLKAMAIALGVILLVALPVIAAMAAVVATIGIVVFAIRENIGGIGDFVTKTFNKIKLFFQGVIQLFRQGGFSGAVRTEMRRAENQGVRRFAINLFRIFFRIKRFFSGLIDGFRAGMKRAAPAFAALGEAFTRLGRALGIVGDAVEGVAGMESSTFESSGARVGQVISKIINVITRTVVLIANMAAGFVSGFRFVARVLKPLIKGIGRDLGVLLEPLSMLTGRSRETGDGIAHLGRMFFVMVRFAVILASALIGGPLLALRLITAAIRAVIEQGARMIAFFRDPSAARLFAAVLPGFSAQANLVAGVPGAGAPTAPAVGTTQGGVPLAAVAQAKAASGMTQESANAMLTELRRFNAQAQEKAVTIVEIDGEKVAEAISRSQRGSAARGGEPVGEE